jgi:putative flippase GtrA
MSILSAPRVAFLRQVLIFGLVGCVGLVIDVGVFNLLRTTVFDPHSVHSGPVLAKTISTSLAIVANWLGNRFVTFRSSRRRTDVLREGVEFAIVSCAGMGIALGCLFISHYLLGYTSLFADNIATNVIGLGLGTVFRFVLYRYWVFGERRSLPEPSLFHSNISSNRVEGWEQPSEVATDGLEQSAGSVVGVRAQTL